MIPGLIKLTFVLRPEKEISKKRISRHEYTQNHCALESDISDFRAFANKHGFQILNVNPLHRTVKALVPLLKVKELFGTQLGTDGEYHFPKNEHTVHSDIRHCVKHIVGFSNKPVVSRQTVPAAQGLLPDQVAQAYNFPANTGPSVTIGIIEYGGGFDPVALEYYWNYIGLQYFPNVVAVYVDGASQEFLSGGAYQEVALDVCIAGALLPPQSTIVVYFAPNTVTGVLDALNTYNHDTKFNPIAISNSWGGDEVKSYGRSTVLALEDAYADGTALGISYFNASGDQGSYQTGIGAFPNAVYPSTSQFGMSIGGTSLLLNPDNSIYSEEGWVDSGGGLSTYIVTPSWQIGLPFLNGKRASPDFAADGDPATGFIIALPNIYFPRLAQYGGTSAGAPLWTSLFGRFSSLLGGKSFGDLHSYFYTNTSFFNDITVGNACSVGYDQATGLGSPQGTVILNALKQTFTTTPKQPVLFEPLQVVDVLVLKKTVTIPASNTITFAQTVSYRLLPAQHVNQTLTITDQLGTNNPFNTDSVVFTDVVTVRILQQQNVADTITFTQSGRIFKANFSLSDTLTFTQTVHNGSINQHLTDNLILTQSYVSQKPIYISISDTLNIFNGTDRSPQHSYNLNDTLSFLDKIGYPKLFNLFDTLSFIDHASNGSGLIDFLQLSDILVLARTKGLIDTINLNHSISVLNRNLNKNLVDTLTISGSLSNISGTNC